MRILFIGDVVGRTGRDALTKHLPDLKKNLRADVVVVNGENAAHGIGITPDICKEFYALGTDVISTGNHIWDQREIIPYIDRDPKLLRPINFPKGTVGKGYYLHALPDGRKILVINAMARLFMDPLDDPFLAVNDLLNTYRLGAGANAILLDFHGEATSEKMAMGHYLDGRASIVVGTHTHVPTADVQIMPGGTAYQTDAGMTCDFDSVIGFKKDVPIQRFTRKMPTDRLTPAEGEGTVCGLFVETDDKTGLAKHACAVRVGGRLKPEMPDF
ncbi:MAG: TIGR00282 family metallophosphoesterase [Micavibrio sp.]